MEKYNRQQAFFAKLQCLFSAAAAVCCAGVLVVVLSLVPQIRELGEHLDYTLLDLEITLTNLESITDELATVDLAGMVDGIDELVSTSQSSVEGLTEKVGTVDFDTLNRAIGDLADVVEPLARFFNTFN